MRIIYSKLSGAAALLFAGLCLVHPCSAQLPEQLPVFNVKHYGARGNGSGSYTWSINKAITACMRAGGGTIYVPAGTYVIGSIQLFSNMNLYLESGAVLLGSGDIRDYLLQRDFGFS